MSKSVKLPIFFGKVLLSCFDHSLLLSHVFHPACVISFYFVPLLYFVHISTITFATLYCIYLIMPLTPEQSLEAEAKPYSCSYSKCHNGCYLDFNLLDMNIIHLLLWLQLLVYDDHSKYGCSSLTPLPSFRFIILLNIFAY